MTRKQALLCAIELIGDTRPELTSKLQEMVEDMPMSHWSEAACYDAIDEYYLTHGKLPSTSEMNRNPSLPSHSTIENRFKMTALEWLRLRQDYVPRLADSTIEAFKSEFERIQPTSAAEYNERRNKDMAVWQTVSARYTASNSFRRLLEYAGIEPLPPKNAPRKQTEYQITTTGGIWAIEERLKQLRKRCEEIDKEWEEYLKNKKRNSSTR